MTNYDYNVDIPDGPNNPSVDQPKMKTNTNNTKLLINEGHYSFLVNNGGLHKQVSMPVLGAIPAGRIASEGTVYTKTANGASQVFYTPDTSTNEYQLTRTVAANFATFGINGNGWTYLPGGLLLKYGFISGVTSSYVTYAPAGPAFTNSPSCIVLTVETTLLASDAGAVGA